ncbi:MAG: CopG family antitoxin [Dehalococcoidia bacterium]
MATKSGNTRKPLLRNLEDIPEFASEAEEAGFWDTHDWGAELLSKMEPLDPAWLPPVRARTDPGSIQFDADLLSRMDVIAARKHTDVRTLVREFVAERLCEAELQEGIRPSEDGASKSV